MALVLAGYSRTHLQERNNAMSEHSTETNELVNWNVFDKFTFLMNVSAFDKESATEKAIVRLGLGNDTGVKLTVFLAGDTVTAHAAGNTFSLFQKHGGLAFEWPGPGGETRISREECKSMVDCMRLWINQPESGQLAKNVGSDLAFVRDQIMEIEGILKAPRWALCLWVVFNPFNDDNREASEDFDRADAYCNDLYTSSPFD